MFRNSNFSNFDRSCITKKSLNVALAILFGGAASLSIAQPPKESFADAFATMQELSSNSSNWQRDKPVFNKAPREPSAAYSLRDYQALSSNSSQWQLDQGVIAIDKGPTFAKTHPHGLSFSEYQAYASNSDEFALPPNADTSSFAATGTANMARDNAKPTLSERIAGFLRRAGATNADAVK
jgi:hypothetical protein